VGQRTHYLKEDTMAMNPYEMRWDYLQTAQTRLENKLANDISKWDALKEAGEDPGQYPEYPTAKEIHAVAEDMRKFVENTET
tara:strand:+ start:366 stop:611 length:246 start_codon:yes stop_codon:yes gene_type:complete